MSILTRIKDRNLLARKSKDKTTSQALTCLISEINMIGTNDGKRKTTDEEAIKVINKFKKGVTETLNILLSSNNNTRIPELKEEINLYESFLPQQMTEEELTQKIKDIILSEGFTTQKDIGNIMKILKQRYSGLYDGKTANKLIRVQL